MTMLQMSLFFLYPIGRQQCCLKSILPFPPHTLDICWITCTGIVLKRFRRFRHIGTEAVITVFVQTPLPLSLPSPLCPWQYATCPETTRWGICYHNTTLAQGISSQLYEANKKLFVCFYLQIYYILYPYQDERREIRSNIPLRLKEFPRAKPGGTPEG